MATSYPASQQVFPQITSSDLMNDPTKLHSQQHTDMGDTLEKVQEILGNNPMNGPEGNYITVKARLDNMEGRLGDAPVFVGTTPPSSPVEGMVWLDTSNLA